MRILRWVLILASLFVVSSNASAVDDGGTEVVGKAAPNFPFPFVTWREGNAVVREGWTLQDVTQGRTVVLIFVHRVGDPGLRDRIELFERRTSAFDATRAMVTYISLSQQKPTLEFRSRLRVKREMLWDPNGDIYRAFGVPLDRDEGAMSLPVAVVDLGGTVSSYNPEFDPERDLNPLLDRLRDTRARSEGYDSYDAFAKARPDNKLIALDYRKLQDRRASEAHRARQRSQESEEERRQAALASMMKRLGELEAARRTRTPIQLLKKGDIAPNFYVPIVTDPAEEDSFEIESFYSLLRRGNVLLCFSRDGHYRTLRDLLVTFGGKSDSAKTIGAQFVLVAPISKGAAMEFKRISRSSGIAVWDPDRRIAKNFGVAFFPKRTDERQIILVGQDRRVKYTNSLFSVKRDMDELSAAVAALASGE